MHILFVEIYHFCDKELVILLFLIYNCMILL